MNPSGPKSYERTDPLFLEHFAVFGLAAGGGISESDTPAFTVEVPFEASGSGRTALLSLPTPQGTIYVARHVFVPPGNAPYVVISYKILNPLEQALPGFSFFQTADYDHYDTGSRDEDQEGVIEDLLRAQGQEDPQVVVYEYQTDKARRQGNVVMIEDRRPTFPLGLTANLPASNYGMDHWFIEDFEDWDNGDLNGRGTYPRPGDPYDTGTLFGVGHLGMGDPSVGMQFDVPGILPGGVYEVDMRLLLGRQPAPISDAAITGPEIVCVHKGGKLGKMEEADGVVRLNAKAGGGSFVWSENDSEIEFVGPLKNGGGVDVMQDFILVRGKEVSMRRYDAEVLCAFTPTGGGGVDEAFHLMTVVEVEDVLVEGLDEAGIKSRVERGGNPARNGGGDRIFPDKPTPTDTLKRGVVRVTAKVKPAIKGLPLFLRSFDVDDPFDQVNAGDTSVFNAFHPVTELDPNGTVGNDNFGKFQRGVLEGEDKAGVVSARTDPGGKVVRRFTVTQQPGDNFALVASCSRPYLDKIKDAPGFLPPSTGPLEDRNGNEIPRGAGGALPSLPARSSEVLTVWRKLHVESDSMSVVTGNSVAGTIKRLDNVNLLADVTGKIDDESLNLDDSPAEHGRFENGMIMVGSQTVGVSANGNDFFQLKGKLLLPFAIVNGPAVTGRVTGFRQKGKETILSVDVTVGNFAGGIILVEGAPPAKVKSSGGTTIIVEGHLQPAYAAIDDDMATMPSPPDLILMGKYEDAYLDIIVDGGGDLTFNKSTVEFVLNLDAAGVFNDLGKVIKSTDALESEGNRKDDYWIAYILAAYQPNAELVSVQGEAAAQGAARGASLTTGELNQAYETLKADSMARYGGSVSQWPRETVRALDILSDQIQRSMGGK